MIPDRSTRGRMLAPAEKPRARPVRSRRRRILMLAPQLGYGGAEKSFVRLANYLHRHHDVSIALFASNYGGGAYHQEGSEALAAPVVVLGGQQGGALRRWAERWRAFRALKRESDVAISFLSGPNLLNALAGTGTPSIISVRGSKRHETEGSGPRRLLWRLLDGWAYRRANRIVTASWGLAGEVRGGRGSAFAKKVMAVEGSIDSLALLRSADAPVEPEFHQLAEHPTVIACGRLHEQKGFHHLIPIFADVVARRADAKLVIIGDGPQFASLTKLSAELGLRATDDVNGIEDHHILFAGYREHPARYFRLGRVFAFSSLYEGLPNALIEALASDVPILAADCPWGPRSVLGGSAEGGLVPEQNLPIELPYGTLMPRLGTATAHGLWAGQIVAALSEPKPRRTVEERRAAIARFDLETTGSIWIEAIEQATGSTSLPNDAAV